LYHTYTKHHTTTGEIDGSLAGAQGVDVECRIGECALGDMVTDVMRSFAESDFAIYNGGGLQGNLAGVITVGDVQLALPFADTVSLVRVTGEVLLLALENGFSQYVHQAEDGASEDSDSGANETTTSSSTISSRLDGRFPQMSGLKVWWNPALDPGSRVVRMQVTSSGESVHLDRKYTLALGSYIRFGGDSYTVFLDNGR
jgi:5'-nucleotidase / UDP-sugar diphosphatase